MGSGPTLSDSDVPPPYRRQPQKQDLDSQCRLCQCKLEKDSKGKNQDCETQKTRLRLKALGTSCVLRDFRRVQVDGLFCKFSALALSLSKDAWVFPSLPLRRLRWDQQQNLYRKVTISVFLLDVSSMAGSLPLAGNSLWPSADEGGRSGVKSRGALRARERSGGTSPGRGEGYQLLVLPSTEMDTTCASGPGLGGRAWLLEPPPTCQGSTRQKPRSGSYMLISGGT